MTQIDTMSQEKGEKGRVSIENCVEATIQGLEEYTKKKRKTKTKNKKQNKTKTKILVDIASNSKINYLDKK